MQGLSALLCSTTQRGKRDIDFVVKERKLMITAQPSKIFQNLKSVCMPWLRNVQIAQRNRTAEKTWNKSSDLTLYRIRSSSCRTGSISSLCSSLSKTSCFSKTLAARKIWSSRTLSQPSRQMKRLSFLTSLRNLRSWLLRLPWTTRGKTSKKTLIAMLTKDSG